MKNLVPFPTVVRGVLLQQLIQAFIAFLIFSFTSPPEDHHQPSLLVQLMQIMVAMLVADTWYYFVHRYMLHQNKTLYRYIHSQHHKLVVPYAIGALYSHPIEGLLDTCGGALSFLVSGMTARTSVFFFSFTVIKNVDDHCGLWLPGNMLQMMFQNNAAFHDIHHQPQGTKYNYSQPFFPIWDMLLGTYMPYRVIKRPEGGFEAMQNPTKEP